MQGASAVLAALSGSPVPPGYSHSLVILPGIVMGLQNATARKLAVPDLTTTVLAMTIVGIAADSHLVGGSGSRAGRRLLPVSAVLVGAFVGSLLIFHTPMHSKTLLSERALCALLNASKYHVSPASPLVLALIVTALITGTTRVLSRTAPAWAHAS